MKWCRNNPKLNIPRAALALAVAAACSAVGARAQLARWVQDVEGRLNAAFFRSVPMPGGAIEIRIPPKQTQPALTRLIAAAPSQADLYSLRALEEEQQLDFAAAEKDWRKHVELAADKGAARLALADFYHRRLRPGDEVQALAAAALENPPVSERYLPVSAERPWRTYERIFALIDAQALDVDIAVPQYWAWIRRYPKEASLYSKFFDFTLAHKQYGLSADVIAAYTRAFLDDPVFPVSARAQLETRLGPPERALAIYERSFQPLWPGALIKSYFDLLRQTSSLRKYLEQARNAIAADPADLSATARLYYYYQQQGSLEAAQRALFEYRQRKEARHSPWTADELWTLGQLFEKVNNYDDAAREYYALYSLPGSDAASERGLASLTRLLLGAPEQAVQFGAGNLSFYRDIATMDPYPGFLNGILSLLLNSSNPPDRYAVENQASLAYFHRTRAAGLVALFESRFPSSPQRDALRVSLIHAYSVYGASDGVIRDGTKFLTDFPASAARTEVALEVADAYARKGQTRDEFAMYDRLLQELAARAGQVPLGPGIPATAQPQPPTPQTPPPARSPDYARVLDRYIARLVSSNRVRDALALYRREIDRNPNDPGLYERLAAFLEQNRLGAEVEQVYTRAIQQFQDKSWSQKLARWYLRRKLTAQLDKLTQDVARTFSGTDLESYFQVVVVRGTLSPVLYRQLNLYAHQRFPHDLVFVRNLLTAYHTRGTADPAAYERLLRTNWYYAGDLRARFFTMLSQSHRLDAELDAIRAANPRAAAGHWAALEDANPAAVRMLAEGEAWRSHFEAAAPALEAIANDFPADGALCQRAASVYRSLATLDPSKTEVAARIEEKLSQADPRSLPTLTRVGEIYADQERFDRARPFWNRLAAVEPGRPDGYLEAATVFWDYFQFDDALRLIEEGRRKLGNPSLYAYEAGAIYESKRDYEHAVLEYAKGALAGSEDAESRLMALARRRNLRDRIDLLTDNLVSARNPGMAAMTLRMNLLRDQNRRDDLEKFLLDAAERTTSLDLLASIENWGRVDGLPRVELRAVEREVDVTTDPVDKMRYRIALARLEEGQGRLAAGAQVVDALYRESPVILGVVRAAVDYHWRNKEYGRAVDLLVDAAGRAQPEYKRQLTFEAARKSIEAAGYTRARQLLTSLLQDDPFRAEYLAAVADTYARQGDDRGLRAFYLDKIQAIRGAPLPADQRTERIAAMRRALIPVLTRSKDFSGALDQYIEILNRYPEDEDLAREAAAYALAHGENERLTDYYTTAVAASPKDYRPLIVLSRLYKQLEDFPAAIDAYTRAAAIRPDRADFLIERAGLEERLLRLEDAAGTYAKLYDLTYHNSEWLVKVAEMRARQGRRDAAVAALRKAWIEGAPDRAENYFAVARKLEEWNMLPQARQYAEEGLKRAPREEPSFAVGAPLYAGILARLRRYDTAAAALGPFDQHSTPAWDAMADVAHRYFTPEEKVAFASFLEQHVPETDRWRLAQRAGLLDGAARWLNQYLQAHAGQPPAQNQVANLIAIEERRVQFAQLGRELEAYWKVLPAEQENRDSTLLMAADAYRNAGDRAAELRVLTAYRNTAELSGTALERYCQLLAVQPQRLIGEVGAAPRPQMANALANYAVQHGGARLALETIAARARSLPVVWDRAYTSLVGLYFTSRAPEVKTAFVDLLGNVPIGDRIGKPVDRDRQLAGDLWFYYGSRYGEYLDAIHEPGSEDYLPSVLEATPGQPSAYFKLAEYYREKGEPGRARAEYGLALELDPLRADVHDRLALLLAAEGKRDQAIEEWNRAIAAFSALQDRRRVPPEFWTGLHDTLVHIGENKALDTLRPDLDKLLRTYIHRNGSYEITPLAEGILAATPDRAAGVQWLADLARAAADPVQFLAFFTYGDTVPEEDRGALYEQMVRSAEARVSQVFGEARDSARGTLRHWQVEWLKYLVDRRQDQRARAVLGAIPPDQRKAMLYELLPLEIRLAARGGTLAALLAGYDAEPDRMPPLDDLRRAANDLRSDNDAASARRLLEFVYNHELAANHLDAANFLGLAEIRLEERDVAGALTLLRRMNLVSGAPFETLDPAAALLERTGHRVEAVEFLSALVKATPWDADARCRLAKARQSVNGLRAVAMSVDAPYSTRVAAALALRAAKGPALDTKVAELDLVSAGTPISEADASRPYFYQARLEAAAATHDAAARERLLTGALAVDPDPPAPRIQLFRTAVGARNYPLAIGTLRPLLPPYFNDDVEFNPYIADQFLSGSRFSLPERVSAARGLVTAYERTGRLKLALFYARIAQHLSPSPAVQRALEAIDKQIHAMARDEARRPVITGNLEQDRIVRPKGGAQ